MIQGRDAIAHSTRRHYRKLLKQAAHLMGPCSSCRGSGSDFAGEDCDTCRGSGKSETPAWYAFLLLRGAPRWLVNGEEGTE